MIAAIYARKSTEQYGVSDEEKSVTRQIEHGKAYALRMVAKQTQMALDAVSMSSEGSTASRRR